jgi:hypothetical protein
MKKILIIAAGLIAAFVGVGGILPALAQVRDLGAMPRPFIGSYTLGVFLLTLVSMTIIFGLIRRIGARGSIKTI